MSISKPSLVFGCANFGISCPLSPAPTSFGLSVRLIGDADFAKKQFAISTKIFVNAWDGDGSLSATAMKESLHKSLASLKVSKVHTLYCHGPDRKTPLEEQAAAFDKHYREGLFERLGVSNIDLKTLGQWLEIADEKAYIKPVVYQGQYNALCRSWEETIFPTLRKHNISFGAFSPLAGGVLAGALAFPTALPFPESQKGTRFAVYGDNPNPLGKAFRHWYDKPLMHTAVSQLSAACDKENISMAAAALRWITYHSGLQAGDEIVFGASKLEQVDTIVSAYHTGPLPAALAATVSGLWDIFKEEGRGIVQY